MLSRAKLKKSVSTGSCDGSKYGRTLAQYRLCLHSLAIKLATGAESSQIISAVVSAIPHRLECSGVGLKAAIDAKKKAWKETMAKGLNQMIRLRAYLYPSSRYGSLAQLSPSNTGELRDFHGNRPSLTLVCRCRSRSCAQQEDIWYSSSSWTHGSREGEEGAIGALGADATVTPHMNLNSVFLLHRYRSSRSTPSPEQP